MGQCVSAVQAKTMGQCVSTVQGTVVFQLCKAQLEAQGPVRAHNGGT